MKNELIKISTKRIDGEEISCVSARELFEELIIKEGREERFSQWFNRHLKYGFEEKVDYMVCKKIYAANQYGGEKELTDYIVTLDMAKELCMLQKSEAGRKFRKYFIQCEKKLKENISNPLCNPNVVSRAEYNRVCHEYEKLCREYSSLEASFEMNKELNKELMKNNYKIEKKYDTLSDRMEDIIALLENKPIAKQEDEEEEIFIQYDNRVNPVSNPVVAVVFINNKPKVIATYESQSQAGKEVGRNRFTVGEWVNSTDHTTTLRDNHNRVVYFYKKEDFEKEFSNK